MPSTIACFGLICAPNAPASTTFSTVSTPISSISSRAPGVKRRLGQLDGADVALRHRDQRATRCRAVVQHVGMGAAFGDAARGAGLIGAADQAALIDKARHPHLGHGFDDARAADAGDAGFIGGGGKARIVGPQIGADDAEARFLGDGVNLDPLNRAGGGTLARGNLRAFKRRAGGRGTGQHAGFIAQKQFGIGADIDDQHHFFGFVRFFRQAPPRRNPRRHGPRCRAGYRRGRQS